jgi:hypothetical protein
VGQDIVGDTGFLHRVYSRLSSAGKLKPDDGAGSAGLAGSGGLTGSEAGGSSALAVSGARVGRVAPLSRPGPAGGVLRAVDDGEGLA